MEVPAGDALIGRVVNPLGQPVDGLGEIVDKFRPVETPAPGVMQRNLSQNPYKLVWKPLMPSFQSDVANGIDHRGPSNRENFDCHWYHLEPKGSRHDLYLCGDWSKKINSSYAGRNSSVNTEPWLYDCGNRFGFSTVSIALLGTYAGVAMAEEFMYNGKHVLIVYDDLSKQAVAYRELVLFFVVHQDVKPSQGMSHLHSRLLERSLKFQMIGWWLYYCPSIIETKRREIFLISQPTWFRSQTDKSSKDSLFNAGIRPAIDAGSSVSRVGELPKSRLWRKVRVPFVSTLLHIVNWKPSRNLVVTWMLRLKRNWTVVAEQLKSWNNPFMNHWQLKKQVVILYALTHGFLDSVPVDDILRFQKSCLIIWSTLSSNLWDDSFNMIFQQKKNWMQPLQNLSTSQISNRNRSGRWQFH